MSKSTNICVAIVSSKEMNTMVVSLVCNHMTLSLHKETPLVKVCSEGFLNVYLVSKGTYLIWLDHAKPFLENLPWACFCHWIAIKPLVKCCSKIIDIRTSYTIMVLKGGFLFIFISLQPPSLCLDYTPLFWILL